MNLFFCSTPLQLKIASRIIEVEGLSSIKILFTGIMPNKRNEYYIRQIEALVDEVIYFDKNRLLKKAGSAYLNKMALKLVDELQLQDAASIYIANLNDRFYHHLLSVLPDIELYTFDDGTENVNQYSKFFRNKQYSAIRKAYQRLQGRKYWLEEVLSKTKCHYTIYSHLKNVVSNTQFIPLYHEEIHNQPSQNIKILLGTVYRDVVSEQYKLDSLIASLDSFVQSEGIDLYIPHPREETLYFKGCESLIPEQMSEEVIIDYLDRGYAIDLYGFGGSTQLNLDSAHGVRNSLLESSSISSRVRNGYTLFQGNVRYVFLPE